MSVALTSTSTTSKLTANGVDVLSTDATGEVSAKINGTLQPIQTAIAAATLGINQSWQNMTASRAFGSTYPNATGKPIQLIVQYTSSSGTASLTVSIDGGTAFPIAVSAPTAGASNVGSVVVPTGKSYQLNVSAGSPTLNSWMELR